MTQALNNLSPKDTSTPSNQERRHKFEGEGEGPMHWKVWGKYSKNINIW